MTRPSNEISGEVDGTTVQANMVDTVHAPIVNVTQKAANVNNFLGPVDARGATFAPQPGTPEADPDQEATA